MGQPEALPPLPPAPPPQTRPWVILVAALVVACGLCVGLIGLLIAFGDPILHSLGMNALQVLQSR